ELPVPGTHTPPVHDRRVIPGAGNRAAEARGEPRTAQIAARRDGVVIDTVRQIAVGNEVAIVGPDARRRRDHRDTRIVHLRKPDRVLLDAAAPPRLSPRS